MTNIRELPSAKPTTGAWITPNSASSAPCGGDGPAQRFVDNGEDGDTAPEHAGERRAVAEMHQAFVVDPCCAARLCQFSPRWSRGAHHAVHHGQRPVGDPREQADEDDGHLHFRFPSPPVGGDDADKHQNRHDGGHRYDGEHKGPSPNSGTMNMVTPDAGVADAGAHRFPADGRRRP